MMPRNKYYHVIKDLEIHENFRLLLMIKEYHHQAQSFELARRDPAGPCKYDPFKDQVSHCKH